MCKYKMVKFNLLLLALFFFIGCNRIEENNLPNSLIAINNQELSDMLDKDGDYFIYIGRPTCSVCREFEPVLFEVLNEINLVIYYFNTDDGRSDNEVKMNELLDSVDVFTVPTLIHIRNGDIIDKLNGIQSNYNLTRFFE